MISYKRIIKVKIHYIFKKLITSSELTHRGRIGATDVLFAIHYDCEITISSETQFRPFILKEEPLKKPRAIEVA